MPRNPVGPVGHDLQGLDRLLRPRRVAHAVVEIHEQFRLVGRAVSDAVERAAFRCRGLHADRTVRERDGVVAGFRAFARLVVGRFCSTWEDADVGVVGTAAAGIVRLREHGDRLVVVDVPGAVLPAAPAGVGSRRHDAERIGCRRKAVSVAGRADERVDGRRHATPRRRVGGKGKQARNQNRMLDSFHLFLLDFNLNSSIADLVF